MAQLIAEHDADPEAPPKRPWRELAMRSTGGAVVRLYWRPREDDVVVYVEDEASDEGFVLEAPSSDALAAFYHPYALRSRQN
jgi:hypothetical protein